jgi:glutaredoxin
MKKFITMGALALGLVMSVNAHAADITVYVGDNCPHCDYQSQWMEEFMSSSYPHVSVEFVQVWNDKANMQRFEADMRRLGGSVRGVPTTIINDDYIIGIDTAIITMLLNKHHGSAGFNIDKAVETQIVQQQQLKVPVINQPASVQAPVAQPQTKMATKPKAEKIPNLYSTKTKAKAKTNTKKKEMTRSKLTRENYSREAFLESLNRPRDRFNGRRAPKSVDFENMSKREWLNFIRQRDLRG